MIRIAAIVPVPAAACQPFLSPFWARTRTCFWGGWGGSLANIDYDDHLMVAYVMTKMNSTTLGDVRGVALRDAAYKSIGKG